MPASGKPVSKRTERAGKKLPYRVDQYASIDLDSLVTFAVWSVLSRDEPCFFENLVAECFILFPAKFSLLNYPHWPDSTRIDKSWRRCRTDKGLITGSVKKGFYLTALGEKSVQKTQMQLAGDKKVPPLVTHGTSRSTEEALIRRLREHHVYKRFLDNPKDFQLSEDEFRHLVLTTNKAGIQTVKANWIRIKQLVESFGDQQLSSLLKKAEEIMRELLARRN